MEELISVIVPVYNGGKYLMDSLDSVVDQTYKNLEIILVDDGSTDESLSILKKYEKMDNRIKVLTQKNGGICVAMKLGVAVSNGEYITRHDCDDINRLDRYEKQLEYLKKNDYDLVGCYLKAFGDGDKEYMKLMETLNIPIRNYFDQFNRAYLGKYINGGAVFGKGNLFREINPFQRKYGCVEDRLTFLEFHTRGCKIGVIEEDLYYYRVHGNNSSLVNGIGPKIGLLHIELLFKYLFKEVIENSKHAIVMQYSDGIEFLNDVLSKYENVICVDENNFERFMDEEVCKFNPEESVFFVGTLFFKEVEKFLNNFGYFHLENLFWIV